MDVEAFHWRMRHDPAFAAGMEFCWAHGLPHSVYLGRVHRPGLDPLWTAADRDKVQAMAQWKAGLCGGCGLHPLDWPAEHAETWAGTVTTCWTCRELADTTAQIPEDVSDAERRSLHVGLRPRDQAERDVLELWARGDIDDLAAYGVDPPVGATDDDPAP